MLNSLRRGLISPPWPGVPADGVFTVQTRDAIIDFQKSQGLSPTGTIDERLMRALVDFSFKKDRMIMQQRYLQQYHEQVRREADELARREAEAKRQAQMPAQSHVPNAESAWPTLESFVAKCTEQWNGISADIYSIVTSGALKYGRIQNWASWLYDQIKTKLAPKLSDFIKKIFDMFGFLKGKIVNGWEAVRGFLKKNGSKLIKYFGGDPEKIKNLTAVTKVKEFGKNNWVGLLLAGLPAIYNLLRRLFADESQKAYYEKQLEENIKSFVGALIVMIIGEFVIAGIIAFAAKIGVTVAATAVTMAVGIAISLLDLIVIFITGKGVGDWVMIAIDKTEAAVEAAALKAGKSMSKTLEDLAWGYINALNPMNLVGF